MGSLASGIVVVTALGHDKRPCGLTCSAVCSVSAEPPLLLSCVKTPSRTLDAIRERGSFAVNFLHSQARDVSALFAGGVQDKFENVPWNPGRATGSPILKATVAHAECTVHGMFDAGDRMHRLGLPDRGRR